MIRQDFLCDACEELQEDAVVPAGTTTMPCPCGALAQVYYRPRSVRNRTTPTTIIYFDASGKHWIPGRTDGEHTPPKGYVARELNVREARDFAKRLTEIEQVRFREETRAREAEKDAVRKQAEDWWKSHQHKFSNEERAATERILAERFSRRVKVERGTDYYNRAWE